MPGKYLLIIEDTAEQIAEKVARSLEAREELLGRQLTPEEKKRQTIKIKARIRRGEL